ncbi:MAG TPA: hypothetical protein VIU33_03340 [Nitrospiria bacterium]
MKCPKCKGLMNPEEFICTSKEGGWEYEGWRCVYCGEVIDPLILQNRLKGKAEPKDSQLTGSGNSPKKVLCHS